LLQAAYHHSIELHEIQDWTEKTYSIYKDPLWNTVKQSQGFDDVWFYHCDHLGTPQEMSNQTGAIVWKAQYKAWGECKVEQAKSDFFENSEIINNNIRFQGQYFDGETGLHYNRYRYYSPYVGRFISKDPIGLLGGYNLYQYGPSPIGWIDPLGLSNETDQKKLKRKLSAVESAQNKAVKTRELSDGRIRYYEKEALAKTQGPTRGRSHVTEINPKTGTVRVWEETYDHNGNVNRVHPKMINGEVVDIPHYPPTKADIDQGKATPSGRAIKKGCPL